MKKEKSSFLFHKDHFKFPLFSVFVLISLVAIFFLISSWITTGKKNNTSPRIKETTTKKITLGFWTEGFLNSNDSKIQPQKMKDLELKVGKKAGIASYYKGWEELTKKNSVDELASVSKNGWTPMISVNPYFSNECSTKGFSLYKEIAIGNCDSLLRKIAANLSRFKEPYFFRFAWEMNVATIEWSTSSTGSSPHEFVDAWRRFHDIMNEAGANNAIWVFSPQVDTPTTSDFYSLYPGDAYVDWVALDGYNWGTTQSWSSWQTFNDIFSSSYKRITSLAPKKRLMLAEVNSTDVGGDKAKWYQQMLGNDIPDLYPAVDAIIFFNEDKSKTEGVNWKIDSSKNALESFKKGISNPIYISSL